MAIPDFQTIMLPVLRLTQDGHDHTLASTRDQLAQEFGLTDEERAQLLPSGRQATFSNRIAWSTSYLRQPGFSRRLAGDASRSRGADDPSLPRGLSGSTSPS
jgi:restriction endonuclease Mrr